MITTKIHIKDGRPRWEQRDRFINDLARLPDGQYEMTCKRKRGKASPAQFGWLYAEPGGIYHQVLMAFIDAGHDEYTNIDQIDILMKTMFAGKKVVDIRTGELITIPCNKREFLTIDQIVFVENIRKFCAEYLNWNIEDPDPNWRDRMKEISG